MIPRAVVSVAGVDISCDVELGVSIAHGRSDATSQPDPATASFEIVAFDQATVERLAINAVITVDAVFGDGSLIRRFVGTITDVTVSWEDVDLAQVTVTAASPVALLGRTFIGSEPWPTEDDGDRAERILSVVSTVPYVTQFDSGLEGWSAVPPASVSWSASQGPNGQAAALVVWGGTEPLPLQIFTYAITGLLPGGRYTTMALVLGGTGGGFIAHQPGSVFGSACPPSGTSAIWQTISVTGVADATGKIDIQFWPYSGAKTGSTFRVAQVTVTAAHQIPMGQIDPGTVDVLARDVDKQPALGLLQELAEDCGGLAWHTRDGAICYADNEHRRNTPTSIVLDCSQVLMSPSWGKSTAGLVNDITIGYGLAPEGEQQPTYHVARADSITAYGLLAVSSSTQLATLADATARAEVAIARGALPVWSMPEVPIDLAVPTLDEALTRILLGLEVHSLISVTGLPSQGPSTTATLWVEGWAERISSLGATGTGNWELVLAVTDYCRTSAFARWDDVPAAVTWDTVGESVTWNDVYCLGPPEPGGQRWHDVPANTRWSTVPASVTWDTWNDYVGAS